MPNVPAMSVVIVTPDHYQTIRKTIRHLRVQTAAASLEIVVVAPQRSSLGLTEAEFEPFHSLQIVEVGSLRVLAPAKVPAVRRARAPIVAFAEDHCYPEREWAAALINAHQSNWAAVGPVLRNANPRTMTSWAGFILYFGTFAEPAAAQVTEHLPWHNSSYKRELLLHYGDDLASLLVVEGMLLDDLRAKGHELYFEPAAKTAHVNISLPSSWLKQSFWGGRLYGAFRAQKKQWPLSRRLLYAGGAPLIPPLRAWRALKTIRRTGRQRELLPRIFPALIAGVIPHALGEATGYILGAGNAEQHYSHFETRRRLHLTASDRRAQANANEQYD